MAKSSVVNLTGGIETDDGRTLFGLDAEVYQKMKSKEDPEFERKIGEWIEDVLGEKIKDTRNLYLSLKSGVVLCRLMNKLKPGIIKKFNDKPELHPLMERENINLYLDACWRLGMAKSEIFLTSDLHSRKAISSVLTNIAALSHIAARHGFANPNIAPIGFLANPKEAPKWALPEPKGPVYVGNLKDDVQSQLSQALKEIQAMSLKLAKLEAENASLSIDLSKKRDELRNAGGSANAAEISRLEALLVEKENKIKDMSSTLNLAKRRQSTANVMNKTLDVRERDLAKLRAQVRTLESRIQELEPLEAEMQVLKSNLSKGVAGDQRQINDLKSKIRELEDNLDRAHKKSGDVQQKEREVGELKTKLTRYENDLNKKSTDLTSKDQQIAELKSKITSLEKNSNDKQSGANDLRSQLRRLESEVQSKSNEVKQKESQISELKSRISNLERQDNQKASSGASETLRRQKELGDMNEKLRTLEGDLASKKAQLQSTEAQLKTKEQEITTLKRQLNEAQNSVSEIQQLKNRIREFETMQKQYQDLKKKYEGLEKKGAPTDAVGTSKPSYSTQTIQQKNVEINSLKDQLKELEKEIERLKLINRNVQRGNAPPSQDVNNGALTELRANLKKKEDEVSRLEQELTKIKNTSNSNNGGTVSVLNGQLKKKDEEIKKLEDEIAKYKAQKPNDQSALVGDLNLKISELNAKLRKKEEEYKKLEAAQAGKPSTGGATSTFLELKKKDERIQQLETEVERLKKTPQTGGKPVGATNDIRIKEKDAKIQELETELSKLKNQAGSSMDRVTVSELRAKLRKQEDENSKLEDELQKLRFSKSGSVELQVLQKQVAQLTAKLQQKDKEIEEKEIQWAEVEAEIDNFNTENEDLLNRILALDERLRDFELTKFQNQQYQDQIVFLTEQLRTAREGPQPTSVLSQVSTAAGPKVTIPARTIVLSPKLKKDALEKGLSLDIFQESVQGEGIEIQLFLSLRDKFNSYIFGKADIPQAERNEFNSYFSHDVGRRIFSYTLHQFCLHTKTKTTELDPAGFDLLVAVCRTMLDNLDFTTGGDYISGKILIGVASLLFKKSSKKTEFLYDCVTSHYAWQNLTFWQEYFWDVVAIEIPWTMDIIQDDNQKFSKSQITYLKKTVQTFATSMLSYLSVPAVQLFVGYIVDDMGLHQNSKFLNKLNKFVEKKGAEIEKDGSSVKKIQSDPKFKSKELNFKKDTYDSDKTKRPDKGKNPKDSSKSKSPRSPRGDLKREKTDPKPSSPRSRDLKREHTSPTPSSPRDRKSPRESSKTSQTKQPEATSPRDSAKTAELKKERTTPAPSSPRDKGVTASAQTDKPKSPRSPRGEDGTLKRSSSRNRPENQSLHRSGSSHRDGDAVKRTTSRNRPKAEDGDSASRSKMTVLFRVKAVASFQPRNDTEHPLKEGQEYDILRTDEKGTWYAALSDGKIKWLPASYVKKLS